MDPEIAKKIEKSTSEINKHLNFLKEDKYNDPDCSDSPMFKKNRENFFENFHQVDTEYHRVDKWDSPSLKVYMIIPKSLKTSQKVPFHVLFHGGGLTTGGGNYVHWFCDYKLDLAIKANAITLIPMYRLMPEDRGTEIYEDIGHWWKYYKGPVLLKWINECLEKNNMEVKPEFLKRKELLISGESAGGLLAVHSWFMAGLEIRALYLQYPMLKYYERKVPDGNIVKYMDTVLSMKEVEQHANELVKIADEQRKNDRCVSRSDTKPPLAMLAAVLLSTTKKWESVFKDGKDIKDAPTRLAFHVEKNLPPASFPKIFIVHGTKDEAVPIENTEEFVPRLEQALEDWDHPVKVDFRKLEGLSHGFDYVTKNEPFEKLLEDMMNSVVAAWTG